MSTARFYVVGFASLVAIDTFTQVAFKLASAHAGAFAPAAGWILNAISTPWIYCALAGYLAAFATWMTLLRHAPVGPAFAASHLEVVTVLVAAYLLFDERLAGAQIAGSVCIVLGILCLARSAPDARDG